jgi:hypothetical protein
MPRWIYMNQNKILLTTLNGAPYFHNIQIPFEVVKWFEGETYKPNDWQTWLPHVTVYMETKESLQISPTDSQTSAEEQDIALISWQRSVDGQNWLTDD